MSRILFLVLALAEVTVEMELSLFDICPLSLIDVNDE